MRTQDAVQSGTTEPYPILPAVPPQRHLLLSRDEWGGRSRCGQPVRHALAGAPPGSRRPRIGMRAASRSAVMEAPPRTRKTVSARSDLSVRGDAASASGSPRPAMAGCMQNGPRHADLPQSLGLPTLSRTGPSPSHDFDPAAETAIFAYVPSGRMKNDQATLPAAYEPRAAVVRKPS
jgi:hypothetical protein